ncbi:hypothetical protein [Paenibacillus thalictri]|uniref:Uncharacterized protein n=1 Tax=Paenibacillus thalictri TaxID=2527873 RepID=A0A4Q9DYR4_9BACL|nr:hypothetical protein [Paenibacillus thalictri]TBL81546.1 hypothetical protein EYB31_00595 [Paenibacillus thalictri]
MIRIQLGDKSVPVILPEVVQTGGFSEELIQTVKEKVGYIQKKDGRIRECLKHITISNQPYGWETVLNFGDQEEDTVVFWIREPLAKK